MHRYNPFQPDKIITPSMFAGRLNEVAGLKKALLQTKLGNPSHFLIHGERGIGKSSLLLYIEHIATSARRELPTNEPGYSFITAQLELDSNITFVELASKVGRAVLEATQRNKGLNSMLQKGWDFLSRWEVFGVKYQRGSEVLPRERIFEELTNSVIDLSQKMRPHNDGLLILIDECDKCGSESYLGEFVKSFTEQLSRNNVTNVALGLSGISTVLDKLQNSHESSLRVFKHFDLKPLPACEAIDVVQNGIRHAIDVTGSLTTIEPSVVNWIAERGSQGYPHFIQEYAYAAFDADTDGRIDMNDLQTGVYRENGALDQLGKKYFKNMYTDRISSDDYRTVLRSMSSRLDGYVTKGQLRDWTGLKESTLAHAIAALKDREIIIAKPGARGMYRLPSKSFAVWIQTYADRGFAGDRLTSKTARELEIAQDKLRDLGEEDEEDENDEDSNAQKQ